MAVSETDENQDNYFEGVEKLLEVWFTGNDDSFKKCDLRNIPREQFEWLLKKVHCEVISFSSNEKVDAYVLSESSMFVAEKRFILKTCGTTTPLLCLQPLIDLVNKYTGLTTIDEFFYSRKNFKKPELQKSPHKTFEDEVKYLNRFFDNGIGLRIGQSDEDCWYLYTLSGSGSKGGGGRNGERNSVFKSNGKLTTPTNKGQQQQQKRLKQQHSDNSSDQTLEILMTHLDPQVMQIFNKENSASALEATQKSGIDTILPEMKIDDYLFEPCGYSMNGINKNGNYMTIHITPEPEFSYVSFETNVCESYYRDVIERVIDIFNPGKVVLTLFTNKNTLNPDFTQEINLKGRGLECREVKCCQLRSYDLGFAFYSKFPS